MGTHRDTESHDYDVSQSQGEDLVRVPCVDCVAVSCNETKVRIEL